MAKEHYLKGEAHMSKKIKNQIRSFIGTVLTIAVVFSFTLTPVNAAEVSVELNEIQSTMSLEEAMPMSTNAGGDWSGIKSESSNHIGTVHLVDGTTYTLIVNFRGINGATGSASLRIWGPIGYFDVFDKMIPVDGTSRAYTIKCYKTDNYFIDIGSLSSSGDYAYAVSIY